MQWVPVAWDVSAVSGPQFEWDEDKAARNSHKHGVSFETAATIFDDPRLLTIADPAHSESEERWFSVAWASNGILLSVV